VISLTDKREKRYYGLDGEPITQDQWMARFEDIDGRRLARTEIDEDISVSTVWLGLDHSFGDGPPLFFETVIFGGSLDQDLWRYPTREAALEGHARAVELARIDAALAR
jgi:hypothetical protein